MNLMDAIYEINKAVLHKYQCLVPETEDFTGACYWRCINNSFMCINI